MKLLVAKNGQNHGPFTIEEINGKVGEGAFAATDLAWTEGWPTWQPLSAAPGFIVPVPSFTNPPPVPPSMPGMPAQVQVAAPFVKREIDSLDVSPKWKERFKLIEQIGWDKGMLQNYWNFKSLNLSQRFTLSFNIWGALFSVFYYLAKGMWQKAIILFGIAVVLTLLDIPALLNPLIWTYCAGFANYDFYLLKVQGKQLY